MFPKLPTFAAIALVGAQALACVQYSCNINFADLDNPVFNAALTDNGSQFCAAVNVLISASQWENGDTLYLSCNDDRSASFDMGNEVVDYSYPGFSGSFGTDFSYVDYPDGAYTFYFTANVWGC